MENFFETSLYKLVTPALFGIVVFFLHRLLKAIDKQAEESKSVISDLLVLKDRLSDLGRLSDKVQTNRDEIKDCENDIAVLKRDQTSIWREIDRLKEGAKCKQ